MFFIKTLQTVEPSVVELETELARKFHGDFQDYPLCEKPAATIEASQSLKYPRESDQDLFEPNKCVRYATHGAKRPLDLTSTGKTNSRMKVG